MRELKLSKKDMEFLAYHWWRNIRAGVDGSLGDGESINDRDYKRACDILLKMDMVNDGTIMFANEY